MITNEMRLATFAYDLTGATIFVAVGILVLKFRERTYEVMHRKYEESRQFHGIWERLHHEHLDLVLRYFKLRVNVGALGTFIVALGLVVHGLLALLNKLPRSAYFP